MTTRIYFLNFTWLAVVLGIFYQSNLILSVEMSLFILSIFFIIGIFSIKFSPFSVLSRLGILVYSMPFMHGFEYLNFDFYIRHRWVWGLTPNLYNMNPEIVSRLLMVGAIGLVSLVSGMLLAKQLRTTHFMKASEPKFIESPKATLNLKWMIAFLLLSVLFSWIFAPQDTILEAYYTRAGKSIASGINFNAAWLVSYVMIAAAYLDAMAESSPFKKRIKSMLVLGASLIIIIFLQYLRGKRDCAGLIAALLGLFLLDRTSGSTPLKGLFQGKIRFAKLVVVACLSFSAVASMQMVGYLRSKSVGRDVVQAASEGAENLTFITGTWSAALETPLSVIGDFYFGIMNLHWGSTYRDYLLSLPPGIVAHFLGIQRPIESSQGPAFEMRYGLGGTHILVVPLMNFGIVGVIGFMMLFGFFLGRIESKVNSDERFSFRLFYASILIVIPFWFWYGDMYLIRSIMACFAVLLLYRFLTRDRSKSFILTSLLPKKTLA